jgi:hypothetical protein
MDYRGTTGVDQDYFNEFGAFFNTWDVLTPAERLTFLQRFPPRKSHDFFKGQASYLAENAQTIDRLDQISDEVRGLADPRTYSDERFRQLLCEAYQLIYGKPSWLAEINPPNPKP